MAEIRHDTEELRPGSTLGPYELLTPIGVGGMARVWAARVRGTKDIIALKMLLPELVENVEFRKMFLDEARIASRVRHGNVCSTYQMGEQNGVLYLAMEWLDGPSLVRILRPGREDVIECERVPIRPRIAARIVADACAGLHAAHELLGDDGRSLGVVHRDMSPHNLLFTSDGVVKVTDFGVAKAMGKSQVTIAGQLKGKLAYMAPEQLIGGAIDRRADVFALGCVLYEITTGQRPFQGEHDPQVMTAIMLGRYEPPAAVVPGYPHELAIIVMRALANDAANRYPSAEQMRLALENYLRTSGPAVGKDQLAQLIRERCGEEVDQRAAAVREDAAAPPGTRPSHWGVTSPNKSQAYESGSGMMVDSTRQPGQKRGIFLMLTAALLGIVLGIGVLSYVRAQKRARLDRAAAEAAAVAEAKAKAAASASVTSAPVKSPRVHLRVSPETAVLLVDGVLLPRGTDAVSRPSPGTTVSVLVRADKFEDSVAMIDANSPPEVDVTLQPSAPPTPSATVTGKRRILVDAGGGAKKDSKDPATNGPPEPTGPEAPPNPYEQ